MKLLFQRGKKTIMPVHKTLKKILLIALIFIPLFSYSQTSIPSNISEIKEQVSINMEPRTPGPNEDVTITLEAYGTDLNQADITWKVNGVVFRRGRGEKRIIINSGAPGTRSAIDITITPQSGATVTKSIVLNPQVVDLIWEARTYTPPFYRGKSYFTPEENVVFAAIPDFKGVLASQATYKWRLNGTIDGAQTGYGKSTFYTKGTILMKPLDVILETSADNGAKATSLMRLPTYLPRVYLYEDHPTYGILLNNSLENTTTLNDIEKNIVAYPYFFSGNKKSREEVSYEWKINGNKISVPSNRDSMVFRNIVDREGYSLISVKANSLNTFLQEDTKSLRIDFLKPKNNNEFFSF